MALPADLPDELWTLIIGRLEDPAALSQTSRALNALVNAQAKQCLDHLKAPASLLSDHVIKIESTGGGSSLSQLGRLYLSLKREGYDLEKECRSLDPQKILSSYQEMQDQALVTIFPRILEAANSPLPAAPTTAQGCRRWLQENSALLQRIRSLDLSNLNLKIVPSEIGKLPALRKLNLSNNQLTQIPSEILPALRELNLSNNQLTKLPSNICKLIALQRLNLSNNRLTELPSEIGKLIALEWLDLEDNRLTKLPSDICKLIALHWLYLLDNRLTELPSGISKLIVLQRLDLRNNRLTELPPEIGKLAALRELDLQSNSSLKRNIALERQLRNCSVFW